MNSDRMSLIEGVEYPVAVRYPEGWHVVGARGVSGEAFPTVAEAAEAWVYDLLTWHET
jgi:hypothetical protein